MTSLPIRDLGDPLRIVRHDGAQSGIDARDRALGFT